MLAYELKNGYYTGNTVSAPKGIAPKGYTFTSPGNIPEGQYAKLGFDGVEYTDVEPPVVDEGNSTPFLGTKITKLAFRNRFTFDEKVAVESAAESNASIRVMLKDQEAAEYIDLSRAETVAGVNALVTASLITQQRADEILTNPVTEIEKYR